ncbi:MAG: hypothetical protein AAFO91_19745, partial [Bacteroidota bacterium]
GEKTRAHSRSSFTHLPNYLLLHLALFTYENGANVKRMEKVELVNPLLVQNKKKLESATARIRACVSDRGDERGAG